MRANEPDEKAAAELARRAIEAARRHSADRRRDGFEPVASASGRGRATDERPPQKNTMNEAQESA
jgi:hypothetical protein